MLEMTTFIVYLQGPVVTGQEDMVLNQKSKFNSLLDINSLMKERGG